MNSKTILITGATSGFGKLAVRKLLAHGHTVIAGVRGGQPRLEKIFAAELNVLHATGRQGQLRALDLHLENTDTFAQAVALVDREFGGRLDVLINNAGYVLLGPLETHTHAAIQRQFDVNFFGPVELTRALLPALKAAGGRVLNVSSALGMSTLPYYSTYAASKHALEALTEGLAYDMRKRGVQVGLIEPGSFRTEIVSSTVVGPAALDPKNEWFEPMKSLLRFSESNLKFGGNPQRVADLIVKRVEQRRVPIRSIIGTDAWLLVLLKRFMPERARVALAGWLVNAIAARVRKDDPKALSAARLESDADHAAHSALL